MSRFPANNSNSYVLGPSRQMHRLSANQDPGLEKDHLLGHRGVFWKSFLLRSSRGYSSLQLYQAANLSFLDFLISYMGDCVKVHVGLGFPGLCQAPGKIMFYRSIIPTQTFIIFPISRQRRFSPNRNPLIQTLPLERNTWNTIPLTSSPTTSYQPSPLCCALVSDMLPVTN